MCSETVETRGMRMCYHQCTKPVHKDGYCKIHHPDTVKARDAASLARHRAKQAMSPLARLRVAQDRIVELEREVMRLKKKLKP